MNLFSSMYNLQNKLSSAQATPLVGPLFVSPCKMLVSVAQIIVGFVSGIFFGCLTVFTGFQKEWPFTQTLVALGHVGIGCISFGYSAINLLTLGLAAYNIESASSPRLI